MNKELRPESPANGKADSRPFNGAKEPPALAGPATSGNADKLRQLIERFCSKKLSEREAAAPDLLRMGAPAVPALSQMLRHEDWVVGENAAKMLGRMGDVSAVPSLLGALKDEQNEWVRAAIIYTIPTK